MTDAPRLDPSFLTRPLAHRTLHDTRNGRPENSLIGARAAMAAGYGIEIDLQLSADGVPMVFHDDVLNRLTPEVGPVRARRAAELQAIRLTHGAEGIPTLDAFLAAVAGAVPLLVELKDQSGDLGPAQSGLEEAACARLAGYAGPVALMSFNPHMVARCKALAPAIPRGLVTEAFAQGEWPEVPAARLAELSGIPDLARVGGSFISHDWRDLGSAPVARAAASGAEILCWTVRSAAQETVARRIARNITFEQYLAQIPG